MATCHIMAHLPGQVLMSVVRLRHLPPRWYCCYCCSENFLPASSQTVFQGYKCWDRQENCNSLSSTIPEQVLTAALPQYCLYCSSVTGLFFRSSGTCTILMVVAWSKSRKQRIHRLARWRCYSRISFKSWSTSITNIEGVVLGVDIDENLYKYSQQLQVEHLYIWTSSDAPNH